MRKEFEKKLKSNLKVDKSLIKYKKDLTRIIHAQQF
jgi:hypothetical protein